MTSRLKAELFALPCADQTVECYHRATNSLYDPVAMLFIGTPSHWLDTRICDENGRGFDEQWWSVSS